MGERELQKYCETQFVSKNKNLQAMIMSLLKIETRVEQDVDIYHYVKNNYWRELDLYIRGNPGKINFFRILTQFFLFRYYSAPDIKISRKQFQIALGIQQVRWMVDDVNPNKIIDGIDDAEFLLWEEIPFYVQGDILLNICKNINVFYDYSSDVRYNKEKVSLNLAGTIWYHINGKKSSFSFNMTENKPQPYFPIPETLNFSKIACKYASTLMFGSISEQGLLKYQLFHNMRPYAAHLPDSASNLTIIHDLHQSIVVNWAHDFTHQNNKTSCDMLHTYRYINMMCKKAPIEPYVKVTAENIVDHIENNGTFQQCMDSTHIFDSDSTIGDKVSGALNDTGAIYGTVPVIE